MFFNIGKKGLLEVLRSRLIISLAIGCAAILSFYVAKEIAASGTVQAQGSFTPYIFHMDVYSCDSAPCTLWARETHARRSDGAKARAEDLFASTGEHSDRKITLPDGTSVHLDDNIAAKTTCHPTNKDAIARYEALMSHMPENCVFVPGETLTGYGTLFNQTVAIVTSEMGKLNPGYTMKFWRAPALGCLELKYQVNYTQPDGSLKLITDGRPVSLELQEPDPALFDIGATYTEMLPSQMMHASFERRGLPWTSSEQQTYQELDQTHNAMCQP